MHTGKSDFLAVEVTEKNLQEAHTRAPSRSQCYLQRRSKKPWYHSCLTPILLCPDEVRECSYAEYLAEICYMNFSNTFDPANHDHGSIK